MMKPKNSNDKTTITAREVAVLVEDLRSQFRTFGDGLKALEEKFTGRIEGIATNQAKTLEKITVIEISVRRMQADIAEIKTKFEGQEKRLTHLETAAK